MKKIKNTRVFLGSAVFAGMFYLVAKILNIYVFDNLFFPTVFGFIVGAEIGFWITNSSLSMHAHKETIKFMHQSIYVKKIILFFLWLFALIAGLMLLFSSEMLQILFNDNVKTYSFIFFYIFSFFYNVMIFDIIKNHYKPKNFIFKLIIYPIIGFLSVFIGYYTVHVPLFIIIEKTIYIVYFLLAYIGLILLFSLLRLSANSQIASVAMGGVFGAFCGYLMPGWHIWEAKYIIESIAVSMFFGGNMGVLMYIIGKYKFTKIIFDLLLLRYPCFAEAKNNS